MTDSEETDESMAWSQAWRDADGTPRVVVGKIAGDIFGIAVYDEHGNETGYLYDTPFGPRLGLVAGGNEILTAGVNVPTRIAASELGLDAALPEAHLCISTHNGDPIAHAWVQDGRVHTSNGLTDKRQPISRFHPSIFGGWRGRVAGWLARGRGH